mmetsp:Transcript_29509/g.55211  ORF Transcript_29509/g.55211 Transcript_29509/m.55211 type:complete len:643 (-) Transcript_29509:193-2121(-)|eukprot:CAMPEP_0170189928 /NCGR_PEP_ID=MMETSP0040_2-20121228/48072_1 /TAXON_ID=641309 /ORGANISM="Lotharella oceanica, Strain CCMP622" /LENGTH=642 /DNA_ID=CAMNT_0010437645 /DNA_START=22 /DNA_END=1950 /DNA_ORIENTATION=-
MSVEDQLTREAVRDMLKEINKKMFTQKKEAISKFISYIKTAQPKLSESTIEYLLVGDRKSGGIVQGAGNFNWKGAFHKYTNVLLDLLKIMLSREYDHHKIARRVFLRLDSSQIADLHLKDHSRKKSGNNSAALWIMDLMQKAGKEIPDKKRNRNVSMMSASDFEQGSVSEVRESTARSLSGIAPQAAPKQVHAANTCVTADSKQKKGFMKFLSGFFNRRPDQKQLEKQGILQAAKVFGAPLDVVIRNYGVNGLPKVVVDCVERLRAHHLTHEGLFRIPGNNTNIIKLKQKYDYGDNVNLSEETANDISGLLKLYLRDMPEPLFPWAIYDSLLEAYEKVRTDQGKELRSIVAAMPESRLRLMKYCFQYFHLLSLNSGVNKMKSRNIAICLAPNILRPKVETLQTVAQHAPMVTGTIRWLIDDNPPEKKNEAKSSVATPMGATTPVSVVAAAATPVSAAAPDMNYLHGRTKSMTSSTRGSVGSAQELLTLPPGWQEVRKDGKVYYYNRERNFSQWERPIIPAKAAQTPKTLTRGLKTPLATPKAQHSRDQQSVTSLPSLNSPSRRKMPPPFKKKKGERKSISGTNNLGQSATRQQPEQQRHNTVPAIAEETLPEGWTSHVEQTTKKVFYFHKATNTSQWVKPTQ